MFVLNLIAFGKRVQNSYNELCLPVCMKYSINNTCFDILLFLANHPEYCTARDVQNVRGIKTGMASVAVEALIQKGYLVRAEDPNDRRIKKLSITEAATSAIEDGRKVQACFSEMMRQGITDEERIALQAVLEKFAGNISALEEYKEKIKQSLQS